MLISVLFVFFFFKNGVFRDKLANASEENVAILKTSVLFPVSPRVYFVLTIEHFSAS